MVENKLFDKDSDTIIIRSIDEAWWGWEWHKLEEVAGRLVRVSDWLPNNSNLRIIIIIVIEKWLQLWMVMRDN